MKTIFRACVVLLPWILRRRVLNFFYGYKIHPTARIGLSWIFPDELEMGERASIGHLNVAVHLARLQLGADALIDRSNWITGYPHGNPRHFSHLLDRQPVLVLGAHAAITKQHHFDCTERIEIGPFSTIAGYASQFITHAIDVEENRQSAAPIRIGDYCFVGTNVVVLGGARLPDRSVLGAKALLNKVHATPGWLYAGVPAVPVKALSADAKYFHRATGFVA